MDHILDHAHFCTHDNNLLVKLVYVKILKDEEGKYRARVFFFWWKCAFLLLCQMRSYELIQSKRFSMKGDSAPRNLSKFFKRELPPGPPPRHLWSYHTIYHILYHMFYALINNYSVQCIHFFFIRKPSFCLSLNFLNFSRNWAWHFLKFSLTFTEMDWLRWFTLSLLTLYTWIWIPSLTFWTQ